MLNRGVFANAGITPRDVTHHQLTYDSSFICDLADPFSHDQLFLIVGAVLIQLTTEERPRWPKEAGVANMDQSLKGKKQLDGYLLAAQYEPMFSNGRRYGFVEGMVGTRFFHPGTTSDEYWTGEPTAQEEMEDYMIEQINKDD
jgi:hypothetical protein